MTIEIVVPEMGESVVEATVSRWLKKEGDHVAVGEAVVELETDKVNLEVGAEQAGILVSVERQEGEDVQIGDVLALLEAESSDGREGARQKTAEELAETREQAEAEAEEAVEAGESAEDGAEPTEREVSEKERAEESPPEKTEEKVTPMARRLAREHDLDLARVPSSGERITREDVERYLGQLEAETEDEPEPRAAPEEEKQAPRAEARPSSVSERAAREERSRMSRRRQTIARRLVEAQQSAAMLTTFNEIDMSAVIDLRQRRRDSFQERHRVKLGFMSFFVKAAVGALKQFPQLNAEIDGNEIVLKHYYDIGMAIGSEEGLVVPVLRDADRMSFAEIERTIEAYVEKVNDGSLSLEDLRGGTFTITNGGVFGSLLSTPILNPPQVGILGLHKFEKRPIVSKDEIVIRPMMYVALSYDHRLVDGREAVQFLVRVKELIEDPETLLLEG
jgi:2-oxoglutarate dehydrogenase E2 component (dihydrolipoamide succinyltransferase)